MTDDTGMAMEKRTAAAWFRQLRDEIVTAFEALEDSQQSGPTAGCPPGVSRSARRAAPRTTVAMPAAG